MRYLLDTNTFIEAKNEYYRFSFCPAFWVWIRRENAINTVYTIDKIKKELLAGNDDLTAWIKTSPKNLFLKPTNELSQSLNLVAEWVNSKPYTEGAKLTFFGSADYYLVAYAHALNCTVVTRERKDPVSKIRVKIPDACHGVGVSCINPFQLLEIRNTSFVCS